MGQTLSEPVTEKHTTMVRRGKKFWVGLSDMQGWRISMEDSHSIHLYLPHTPDSSEAKSPKTSSNIPEQPAGCTVTNDSPELDDTAFFGVFDGHGGATVAKFTGMTLHSRLAALDSFKAGDYSSALTEAFLKTDEDLRADPNFLNDPSGCTAVVGLVTKDGRIIVANSGDSRSILGHKGSAKALSHDHKPTNRHEALRIISAGGYVEFGRVNGNLALSRALGDFEFKQNFSLEPEKQIVTADPDLITHQMDGEEEFLVLACDGIWDCLSSQNVVDFVRRAVANGDDLGKICENMMTKCLAKDSETGGIGCDNMTVVIVALLNGRTPEEWQGWVKERVEKKVGYDTPESIPDVFAQSQSLGGISGSGFRTAGAGGLANIASILGASGITFRPADDSDDDDEDDLHIMGTEANKDSDKVNGKGEEKEDGYLDDKALKGITKPIDVSEKLSNQEKEATAALLSDGKRGSVRLIDDDGDSHMDSGDESDETTTGPDAVENEAPTLGNSNHNANAPNPPANPPSFRSIGSPNVPSHQELQEMRIPMGKFKAPNQLSRDPAGDAPPAVAKVEGLMDGSEDPMKL